MANEQAPRDDNHRPTLLAVDDTTGETRPVAVDGDGNLLVAMAAGGGGDVSGPASSTDNALALWDGTGGDTLKDSSVQLVTSVLSPVTNDTVALGSGTLMWSDLFLASGGVINFNNGDWVATHSAGVLTVGTGDLRITTAGTNSASVVTVGGTQTLTNKTLTSPTLNSPTVGTEITIPNSGLHILDTNASHDLIIAAGSDLTSDRTLTISTGDANRTLTLTGNASLNQSVLTTSSVTFNSVTATTSIAVGSTGILGTNGSPLPIKAGATASSTLLLQGRDVDGGTYITFLTITSADTPTCDLDDSVTKAGNYIYRAGGTDVVVADGGTGVSSLTAYAPIFGGTTATGAVQSGTVGTAGQVLTSNGAGALPTFQDAAGGGGTPRRNLSIQLNITNGQTAGTANPTNSTNFNGVSCANGGTDGSSSILKINASGSATGQWEFYDKNPEMNFDTNYSGGSATGNGTMWFGDTADTTPPTNTQTSQGMFIMTDTASGTATTYAVNANNTNNTNTALAGITIAQGNAWRIIKDGTTNIKFYYNYTLKATHTTNLPSGGCNNAAFITMGVDNDGGDTTSRTCLFGFAEVLLDSPTG